MEEFRIGQWDNGIYAPVWIERNGIKIADFGHKPLKKEQNLKYAEIAVKALNNKLHNPAVNHVICEHEYEPIHGNDVSYKCIKCGEIY